MSDISYRPLIEDMTWSFSRVESFTNCPAAWFLKYIRGYEEDAMFFSSYGKFIHSIIERYYKGELSQSDMLSTFLKDFKTEVKGDRPKESTVEKYIQSGITYFSNFQPFPYMMLAVEKKVEFKVEGIPFIGFIDFLGEKDGKLHIIDHKSRELSPRSKRKTPTKKDMELDEMFRQQYLYSEAIKQEYGEYPATLNFNCFRNGNFITEEFNPEALESAKKWAVANIRAIEDEEDWWENYDYFGCRWLCGLHNQCDYYLEEQHARRRY